MDRLTALKEEHRLLHVLIMILSAEDDKKGDSDSIHPTGWNNATYEEIGGACQVRTQIIPWCFGGSDTDKKII